MKQVTTTTIGSKILEQTGSFSAYDITAALRADGYFVEHSDVKAVIEDALGSQGLIKHVDTNNTYGYRVFELVKPDVNYIQQTASAPVSKTKNTSGYSVFYKGKIFIAPNQKAAWGNKSNAVAQFGRWFFGNYYDFWDKKQRRVAYKSMKKIGELEVVDKISIAASDI